MKIRIGNDFKTKWAITWLGEPEDFSDATDIALFFNIYDKKIELTKDVDYTITDNIIEIDVTPDICNILGVYNLELHYTKPNDDFIDGERRSAVDIDAFRIVGKSDKADATQDVSIISDAVAIFLDIAYKKLEEIEANEDVRITNESEREDAEDIRVANEATRVSSEAIRVSSEEERDSSETVRVQNESERISEESVRQNNESERISEESVRQNNEANRISAETLRVQAEDEREVSEVERVASEGVRVSNEDIRISNEQDRQINTATAISNAEQATLNANNSATYANEQGAYANEQGAYAEEMSSHPPTIINDYWHIWNFTTNQYESTGQYARGDSAVEGALVVQTTGQSAVNTMSQKAVTDELVQLAGDVEQLAYVKIKNLVVNGDFSNGLTGWVTGSNVTASNGIASIDTDSSVMFRQDGLDIPSNSVCYIAVRSQKIDGEGRVRMVLSKLGTTEVSDAFLISNSQEWLNESVLLTTNSNAERFQMSRVLVGGITQLDFVMLVNLTAIFGEGYEPTKEEFELLLATLGTDYFEGEITIPAQKIMQWQLKSKYGIMPLVTIANDDGRATDYELYKMMQRYGMRGTTFAVGTYIGLNSNYLTEEQVKEMADAGWEIACHSYEHKNFTLETFPDGIIYQILENKKYLESITGKKVETLAHPFGGTNAEIRNLIRSFYEGARTSAIGYNDFGDVANVYNLKTFWTDGASKTVEGIKSDIDALLTGKSRHLMLSGHALASEPGGDALTLSEMEEVCAYLKAYQMQGKLEVVTFAEAVRRIK